MIFYAFIIVLVTVRSAPVDNFLTMGTYGGSTLCDISKADCSFFSDNDLTIGSADLDQAFAAVGASVEKPSVFLNLFPAANSGTSTLEEDDYTSNQMGPWAGSDSNTAEIAGSTRSTGTYDCENPTDFRGDPHLFYIHTIADSSIPYGSLVNKKPSEEKKATETPDPLTCTKCDGPQVSDCRPMIADCANNKKYPYQCTLCFSDANPTCEVIDDISRLPSKENPYGQSWCLSKECLGLKPCQYGLPSCISL